MLPVADAEVLEFLDQVCVQLAHRSPIGGTTIGGQKYPGGEFIPNAVWEKATPAERAAASQPVAPGQPATNDGPPPPAPSGQMTGAAPPGRRQPLPMLDRSAFMYQGAKPGRDFQCATCQLWTGSAKQTCAIHGQLTVPGTASCGMYLFGPPTPALAGREQPLFTPAESGLVNREVTCEYCGFFNSDERKCGLYHVLNMLKPETFNLDERVDEGGCCTANSPSGIRFSMADTAGLVSFYTGLRASIRGQTKPQLPAALLAMAKPPAVKPPPAIVGRNGVQPLTGPAAPLPQPQQPLPQQPKPSEPTPNLPDAKASDKQQPQDIPQLGQPHPQHQQAAHAWLALAQHLPAKMWQAAKEHIQQHYKQLEGRYGKRMAAAIIGAGLAGTAMPVPGSGLLAAAPLIAGAELYHHLHGLTVGQKPAAQMSAEQPAPAMAELHELGRKFMAQVQGNWQWAKHAEHSQQPKQSAKPHAEVADHPETLGVTGGKFSTFQHHAPAGGVTIAGKLYAGGEFIPNEVWDRATPAEAEALAAGYHRDIKDANHGRATANPAAATDPRNQGLPAGASNRPGAGGAAGGDSVAHGGAEGWTGGDKFPGSYRHLINTGIAAMPVNVRRYVQNMRPHFQYIDKAELERLPGFIKSALTNAAAATLNHGRVMFMEGREPSRQAIQHELVHSAWGNIPKSVVDKAVAMAVEDGKAIYKLATQRRPADDGSIDAQLVVNQQADLDRQIVRRTIKSIKKAKDKTFSLELDLMIPPEGLVRLAEQANLKVREPQYLTIALHSYMAKRGGYQLADQYAREEVLAYRAMHDDDLANEVFQYQYPQRAGDYGYYVPMLDRDKTGWTIRTTGNGDLPRSEHLRVSEWSSKDWDTVVASANKANAARDAAKQLSLGGAAGDVPEHELGQAPIPPGHIRVFHYTHGDPAAVRKDGLKISMAKGHTYGEPDLVWGSTKPPDRGHNIVEYHVPKDDPGLSHAVNYPDKNATDAQLREWEKGEQHVGLVRDVKPAEIIAVHEPWHQRYRYLKNNPKVLQAALAGDFDHLLSNPEYGPAVAKVKADAAKQLSQWERFTTKSGHTGWKNAETGERRYQENEPGTRKPADVEKATVGGFINPGMLNDILKRADDEQAKKAAATPPNEAVAHYSKMAEEALQNSDVVPAKRDRYLKTWNKVLSVLPPAALTRLQLALKAVRFTNGTVQLTNEARRDFPGKFGPDDIVGGWFDRKLGQINLDGGHESGEPYPEAALHVYAHEMTHAIDMGDFQLPQQQQPGFLQKAKPLSATPEWYKVWEEEIMGPIEHHPTNPHLFRPLLPPRLSGYARSNVSEGFAEFGRLVYTDLPQAQRRFPKAYAYFQERGLVPVADKVANAIAEAQKPGGWRPPGMTLADVLGAKPGNAGAKNEAAMERLEQ